MKYLQSAQNDSKNDENLNFKIFPENSNPELHISTGFDGIRQFEQFLCLFEIYFRNREFSMNLLL